MNTELSWGIIITIALQIIGFSYWMGRLSQQVTDIKKSLESGTHCPMHSDINKKMTELEIRSNIQKEIDVASKAAVAAAKALWDHTNGTTKA